MVFQDLGLSAKSRFQFAFQILPTIIFFSAVMAVLYRHRANRDPIHGRFVKRAMGTTGPETACLYRRTSSLAELRRDDSAVSAI